MPIKPLENQPIQLEICNVIISFVKSEPEYKHSFFFKCSCINYIYLMILEGFYSLKFFEWNLSFGSRNEHFKKIKIF